jgi:hypothetical protein
MAAEKKNMSRRKTAPEKRAARPRHQQLRKKRDPLSNPRKRKVAIAGDPRRSPNEPGYFPLARSPIGTHEVAVPPHSVVASSVVLSYPAQPSKAIDVAWLKLGDVLGGSCSPHQEPAKPLRVVAHLFPLRSRRPFTMAAMSS